MHGPGGRLIQTGQLSFLPSLLLTSIYLPFPSTIIIIRSSRQHVNPFLPTPLNQFLPRPLPCLIPPSLPRHIEHQRPKRPQHLFHSNHPRRLTLPPPDQPAQPRRIKRLLQPQTVRRYTLPKRAPNHRRRGHIQRIPHNRRNRTRQPRLRSTEIRRPPLSHVVTLNSAESREHACGRYPDARWRAEGACL